LLDKKIKTVVFNAIKDVEKDKKLIYSKLDFNKRIPEQILSYLYDMEIQSLIVEGGSLTLQRFIDKDLWDEARVFTGDILFGKGLKAPVFGGKLIDIQQIKNDELRIYRND
jgi:diaminohydroxyphosphoribosylaminopyrimidine deaminase/5-amino-6-(5-phosphoribosylamino)uracil reductase